MSLTKKITMKKSILFCILIGVSLSTYSQLRYFLPDSNAYFSVSSYKFWFSGDTSILDKAYKKVYIQNYDYVADIKKATYYASVREDTIEQKIYCIPKDKDKTFLIADFSKNESDTLSVYSFWPESNDSPQKYYFEVTSVDSILIGNKYRKRINLNEGGFQSESWIEGIGSTCGLFFPGKNRWADLGQPVFLCYHQSDTLYYIVDNTNDCYEEIFTGINTTKKFNFVVYPTLAINMIYVNSSSMEILNNDFSYRLYDLYGRLISAGGFENNSISLSSIASGCYIINIYNNSNVLYSTKFFKL